MTSHQIKFFIGLSIDLANNDPICGTNNIQNDPLITEQKPLIRELNLSFFILLVTFLIVFVE